jgi:hypothetical protein
LLGVGAVLFGGIFVLVTINGVFGESFGMAEGNIMEGYSIVVWLIELSIILTEKGETLFYDSKKMLQKKQCIVQAISYQSI